MDRNSVLSHEYGMAAHLAHKPIYISNVIPAVPHRPPVLRYAGTVLVLLPVPLILYLLHLLLLRLALPSNDPYVFQGCNILSSPFRMRRERDDIEEAGGRLRDPNVSTLASAPQPYNLRSARNAKCRGTAHQPGSRAPYWPH